MSRDAAPMPRVDLPLVVTSHGWYDLPPFAWTPRSKTLSFVFLEGGRPVTATVRAPRGKVAAAFDAPVDPVRGAAVVRRVLDLDADLGSFHRACRARAAEGFGWIADRAAGRMLRSPSLFEDAVKVLFTTNCSWSLTRAMVTNLVGLYGRGGAFPPASFVAGLAEKAIRDDVRAGYRAPFLLRFAEGVASGRVALSRWEDGGRSDDEVEKDILAHHGFGPYAADTLGRLLGRHAKLGLDSWSRKEVARLRFRGRKVADARVARFYASFGRFAGLAFWLDVTREWHEPGGGAP